jgi:predicted Zn-dependent protease
MAEILSQMEATIRLLFGERKGPPFFDSHPLTPERVDDILAASQEIPLRVSSEPRQFESATRYLQKLEGLCFGPNPAYGIRRNGTFIHPELNFSIEIPIEWEFFRTTSIIGAADSGQENAFFFGLAHYGYDVSAYGENMKELFYDEFRLTPLEEDFTIMPFGSRYSLVYRDHSGGHPVVVHFSWIEIDGNIFQFIAFGNPSRSTTLDSVVESIQPLGPGDLQSLTVLNLRLIEAQAGDSLESIRQRERNEWSTPFTAIANSIPEDTVFQGGEMIKIVRREPYRRSAVEGSLSPSTAGQNPESPQLGP